MPQIEILENQTSSHDTPAIDPVQSEVEAALSGIQFRQPIVDDHDPSLEYPLPGETFDQKMGRRVAHNTALEERDAKIDYEWLVLTESARRAILQNEEARKAARSLVRLPLSEELPMESVRAISEHDKRTAELAQAMGSSLVGVLQLRSVPDELLQPSIKHARPLVRKEVRVRDMARRRKENADSEKLAAMIEDVKEEVERTPGVTEAEKKLAARRYRYARDAKLLGLMAELRDNPIGEDTRAKDGLIEHELESGTKLVMDAEAYESSPSLLDPSKWERRRQLKDRVYVVTVAGQDYVLKERNTPRHESGISKGAPYGVTSSEEFEAGREFASLGTIQEGDITLHWEKPLGYVEFPDGYEFCLFEMEPGLGTAKNEPPHDELKYLVIEARGEYEEEYERIKQVARQIYNERPDLIPAHKRPKPDKPKKIALSRADRKRKKYLKSLPDPAELTFEEFAELKVHYLVQQARSLIDRTTTRMGYANDDNDNYGFRIKPGRRPILETVGFDFEYYRKINKEAAATRLKQEEEDDRTGQSALWLNYSYGSSRGIFLAASYAMMDEMGIKIPPVGLKKTRR